MQILSIVGALSILGAFAAQQVDWLDASMLSYQLMNLVGAGLLNAVAIVEGQYGFILLESAWMLVSVWGIITILRESSGGAGGTQRRSS